MMFERPQRQRPSRQEACLKSREGAPGQEVKMMFWFLVGAMVVVGGLWVKTRRQRKARTTYVPSN